MKNILKMASISVSLLTSYNLAFRTCRSSCLHVDIFVFLCAATFPLYLLWWSVGRIFFFSLLRRSFRIFSFLFFFFLLFRRIWTFLFFFCTMKLTKKEIFYSWPQLNLFFLTSFSHTSPLIMMTHYDRDFCRRVTLFTGKFLRSVLFFIDSYFVSSYFTADFYLTSCKTF